MTAPDRAPIGPAAAAPAALADARPTPLPAPADAPPPLGAPPIQVRRWFDRTVATPLPAFDGSLATARATADAFARLAKAANTRRAYRAGVAAWCAWCARHALPCLPASAADVVAFLAAERQRGLAVNTIDLRRAAIRYLHYLAGCAVPTAEAVVGETLAGIRRDAAQRGEFPAKKLAAAVGVLREILAPIGDDLRGRRDRALLLVGFAGALRRSELAAIRLEHLEAAPRGLRLTLPLSKGDRDGKGVTVALPLGTTELCPVRALRRWQDAAGHHRRPAVPPHLAPTRARRHPPPAHRRHPADRRPHRRPHRAGPRRRRRLRRRNPRRPQPQARRADHRHGSRRASRPPQTPRPPPQLRRDGRIPRARRSVRQPPAQRPALSPASRGPSPALPRRRRPASRHGDTTSASSACVGRPRAFCGDDVIRPPTLPPNSQTEGTQDKMTACHIGPARHTSYHCSGDTDLPKRAPGCHRCAHG